MDRGQAGDVDVVCGRLRRFLVPGSLLTILGVAFAVAGSLGLALFFVPQAVFWILLGVRSHRSKIVMQADGGFRVELAPWAIWRPVACESFPPEMYRVTLDTQMFAGVVTDVVQIKRLDSSKRVGLLGVQFRRDEWRTVHEHIRAGSAPDPA